jgi:hypothetical protein
MHDELYTDGVGEIAVSGTVVRVDLVSLSPIERDANNAPKSVFRQRLIFSVEGFANSVELMQKALQGLIDAGAVTRAPRAQTAVTPLSSLPADTRPSNTEKPKASNSSPNFN